MHAIDAKVHLSSISITEGSLFVDFFKIVAFRCRRKVHTFIDLFNCPEYHWCRECE